MSLQYIQNTEQRNLLRKQPNEKQINKNNFLFKQQQRPIRFFKNILSTTFFVKFQLISFLLIYSLFPSFYISGFIIPNGKHGLLIYNSDSEIDYSNLNKNKYSSIEERDNSLKLQGTDLLLLHSSLKHIRTLGDCIEITDRNATLLKSISRASDSLVDLDIKNQHFNVHYCANLENDEQQQCGEKSVCGTIYRWKKAMVRINTNIGLSSVDDLPDIFLQEQVLVPSGCSCLINAADTKFAKMPVIIES
ncbi:hypothetical protein Mgra_00009366 [Meloidogyne graminicola]|uniref:Uncharacterized protein n=1 Tax=Meloidogyne graminicola TaxID=189291 RepID=A0A8S9ZBH7_9BILA|nr:hypothetical protein Mgra_00009366 [Meloidogyne graminicola]